MFSKIGRVDVLEIRKLDLKQEKMILDGAEAYDLLCPVNKLTGNRENPLRLLEVLSNSPEKSRALEKVLQELPVMATQQGVSNDDMLAFMQREFCTGTPYENERWAELLENLSEGIFDSLGVNKEVKPAEQKIDFAPQDAPEVGE